MCTKSGMKIVSHYSHTLSFSAVFVSFGNWERQLSHSSEGSYFQNVCSYEGRSLLGRPKRSLVASAKMGVKGTVWENWTEFMWFRKGLFRSPVIMLFYLAIWRLRLWVTTVGVPIVYYFDQLSVYLSKHLSRCSFRVQLNLLIGDQQATEIFSTAGRFSLIQIL